jgi:hypothetical protein
LNLSPPPRPPDVPEFDLKKTETSAADRPAMVTDLGDRRRALTLETQVAELQKQIAELQGAVRPAIDHVRDRTGKHEGANCRYHLALVVDETKHHVECAWCGEILDPVTVLTELARKERIFCHWIEHLRKEKIAMSKEVQELRVTRSRLRSDVKIAQKRLVEVRAQYPRGVPFPASTPDTDEKGTDDGES